MRGDPDVAAIAAFSGGISGSGLASTLESDGIPIEVRSGPVSSCETREP